MDTRLNLIGKELLECQLELKYLVSEQAGNVSDRWLGVKSEDLLKTVLTWVSLIDFFKKKDSLFDNIVSRRPGLENLQYMCNYGKSVVFVDSSNTLKYNSGGCTVLWKLQNDNGIYVQEIEGNTVRYSLPLNTIADLNTLLCGVFLAGRGLEQKYVKALSLAVIEQYNW